MSTNPQKKEEEVDLGSLFTAIGNLFKGLIDFIVRLLNGIFHFVIQCLLFFKGNLVKFLIAVLIGAGIGAYFQMNKETTYGADMLVQPNFNSSRQLYNIISNYNNLLGQKDTMGVAKALGITKDQAGSLRGFKVTPIKSEDDKIEMYYDIVDSYDSVATMNYSFQEFKESFTDYDYKFHQIHVEAVDSRVFSELGDDIISTIVNNKYFKTIKTLKQKNLSRQDSILRKDLREVDTLRKVYMKAILDQANKSSNGTNIDVGNTNRSIAKEIQLFQTNRVINGDLTKVSNDISEESEIINVISNFQTVGYKVGGLRQNSILIYGAIGFLIMMFGLLLLKLNTYLDNYKRK